MSYQYLSTENIHVAIFIMRDGKRHYAVYNRGERTISFTEKFREATVEPNFIADQKIINWPSYTFYKMEVKDHYICKDSRRQSHGII